MPAGIKEARRDSGDLSANICRGGTSNQRLITIMNHNYFSPNMNNIKNRTEKKRITNQLYCCHHHISIDVEFWFSVFIGGLWLLMPSPFPKFLEGPQDAVGKSTPPPATVSNHSRCEKNPAKSNFE